MTVPFTCSHREISLCLLLETSCPRPPLEVVSVSTAHKSHYFDYCATAVEPGVFLGSMTDVGVELRDCTSLLIAAAVQHWSLKMGLVLFIYLFYALPSFLLCLPIFQKCYFLLFSLRRGMSRAQRNQVFYLNLTVGFLCSFRSELNSSPPSSPEKLKQEGFCTLKLSFSQDIC